MCRRITCSDCGKETWTGKFERKGQREEESHARVLIGCGQHIEEALRGLKEEEICHCKEDKQKKD
jgi:hypothetical protein